MIDVTRELDVTGERCPVPLAKAKIALKVMSSGEVLEVITTDPSSKVDFLVLCQNDKYTLVNQDEREGQLRYWIRLK